MARSFDLRQKKVIELSTAEKIGCIRGMDIDIASGKIKSVTIPREGLWGIFGGCRKISVPWENVVAVGSEYIIVKEENANSE